jgi:hypothetical protein
MTTPVFLIFLGLVAMGTALTILAFVPHYTAVLAAILLSWFAAALVATLIGIWITITDALK